MTRSMANGTPPVSRVRLHVPLEIRSDSVKCDRDPIARQDKKVTELSAAT